MKLIQTLFAAARLMFTAATVQATPMTRASGIAPAAGNVEIAKAAPKKATKKKTAKKAKKAKKGKKAGKKAAPKKKAAKKS